MRCVFRSLDMVDWKLPTRFGGKNQGSSCRRCSDLRSSSGFGRRLVYEYQRLQRKVFNGPTKSRVSQFCETATNAGQETAVGDIKWIVFMPGTEGYIGVTVVDGEDIFFWDGIPSSLDVHLREGSKDVRSVSVGYNDSWIVAYQDGSSNWSGIPAALSTALKASDDSRVLDSVALSPSSADEFLANYEDGSASCVLPAAWMPEVTERVQLLQQDMENMMEIAMMNQSANYSRQTSRNAAVNTRNMTAAAATANSTAAFRTMSSAIW